MKRYVLFSTAIAMLVFATSISVHATTFFVDTFSYADGQLTDSDDTSTGTGANVSGGLWVGHSGDTFGDNVQVSGGNAIINTSGSEDIRRDSGVFNAAGTTWYMAALITVNDTRVDPSTEAINNDYFMHFWGPSFAFRSRVYLDDPNVADPTKFTLGLSATSGGQNVKWASDLDFGTQYKAVISFEFDTGEAKLWVDPVTSGSTSISDLDGGAAAGSFISSAAFRQDFTGGAPNTSIQVDAVALGDMFDSVVADVTIPEPTSLALALAGLVGVASFRRRV